MIALNALATAGAAAAAASAILLHPHQEVYFNGLEDRTTPWRIRDRYEFGHWGAAFRAGLERALAERPGADLRVCSPNGGHLRRNMRILRREDRARIADGECDYWFHYPRARIRKGYLGDRPILPPTWSLAAWGSSFLDAFDADAALAVQRRTVDPVLDRPPDIASMFDVWVHDGRLIYARNDCAPEDTAARFFLHVEPADPADLPRRRRRSGFDNRDFSPHFNSMALVWPEPHPPPSATRRDGRCLVSAPLPDYPIRRVRTGQFVSDGGGGWRNLWEGEIDLAGEDRK